MLIDKRSPVDRFVVGSIKLCFFLICLALASLGGPLCIGLVLLGFVLESSEKKKEKVREAELELLQLQIQKAKEELDEE